MPNITFFCFTTFCVDLPLIASHEITQITLELDYLQKSVVFLGQKLAFIEVEINFKQKWYLNDARYYASYYTAYEHAAPALNAVSDAVEVATDEGRNSSHCYTIATRIIDDAIKNIDFNIDPCIANFTHGVQKIWQKIKLLREEIERAQYFFNAFVPSCYHSSEAAGCLTTILSSIRSTRKCLETMVNDFIGEKEASYSRLKNDFETCNTAIGTKFEIASSLAQREEDRNVDDPQQIELKGKWCHTRKET